MVYTTKIHFDWNESNMPSICMTNYKLDDTK